MIEAMRATAGTSASLAAAFAEGASVVSDGSAKNAVPDTVAIRALPDSAQPAVLKSQGQQSPAAIAAVQTASQPSSVVSGTPMNAAMQADLATAGTSILPAAALDKRASVASDGAGLKSAKVAIARESVPAPQAQAESPKHAPVPVAPPVSPQSSPLTSSIASGEARSAGLAGSGAGFFDEAKSLTSNSKGSQADRSRSDSGNQSILAGPSQAKDGALIPKSENVRIFVNRMESVVQQMKQEHNSSVHLRVTLEQGQIIKIKLDLRGATLKTTIQSDSESVRNALRASWPDVSKLLAQQGVDAESLEFQVDSEGSQDMASLGGQADDQFAQADSEHPAKQSGEDHEAEADENGQPEAVLPFFQRTA